MVVCLRLNCGNRAASSLCCWCCCLSSAMFGIVSFVPIVMKWSFSAFAIVSGSLRVFSLWVITAGMRLLVGSLVASVLSICACFFGSSCTFSVASLAFLLCLSSSCMFSCVELLPSAALSQPVLFSDHSSQLGEWFSACLWFLSVFLYDLLQYITPAFAHLGEKNTHTHTHTYLSRFTLTIEPLQISSSQQKPFLTNTPTRQYVCMCMCECVPMSVCTHVCDCRICLFMCRHG